MNWKLIVFGALAFFVTAQILGIGTGIVIHDGVLTDDYISAHGQWRPELEQDPPDMAALMPMWMTNSFISSLIFAAIFGCIRSSLTGSAAMKGLQFGLIGATFFAMTCLGLFGVFNLPAKIWIWWSIEGYIIWSICGTMMGLAAGKLAPESG